MTEPTDTIFVISQKTTLAEYGYGGWTGRETEEIEVLGYVLTEKEADQRVKDLTEQEATKKKRLYNCREFSWEPCPYNHPDTPPAEEKHMSKTTKIILRGDEATDGEWLVIKSEPRNTTIEFRASWAGDRGPNVTDFLRQTVVVPTDKLRAALDRNE